MVEINSAHPKSIKSLSWYHWLILFFSLMLTIFAWLFSSKQTKEKVQLQFDQQVEQSLNLINDRMKKYEDALWAGTATIQVLGGEVSRNQWRTYYKNLDIQKKYPGISGVGVIYQVSPQNLESHLNYQQKQMPSYQLHPKHTENDYWPISYIEPQENNLKAVGLDMAHEKNRYTASKKAKDTGLAQITGPIILVQDQQKTPGFLFFAPFYKDSKFETKSDREENFIGLVYAPFIVNKLMQGTLNQENRHIGIRIKDNDEIIYDENITSNKYYDKEATLETSITQNMYGRQWTYSFRANISGSEFKSTKQPILILVSGIIIEILLLGLFIILANSNKRAVEHANFVTKKLEVKNIQLEKEINENKELANKANQATLAKSNFLSNMSHEIRTPLNAVIGFINMALKTSPNSNLKNILCNARTASDTLITLINQTLDYSKIESGKLDIEEIEFDLIKLLDKINVIFSSQAKSMGIVFSINIEPSFPKIIVSDPLRIEQILINLCGNAFKFTKEGEVSINVNFEITSENTIDLIIKVKDTGIGIEHTKLDQLFDSFKQADNSTTRIYGGTGLGLAISKELAVLLNGEITVKSKIEHGSQFSIDIPVVTPYQDDTYSKPELHSLFSFKGVNKQIIESDEIQTNNNGKLDGKLILLVEDTEFNQIIAQSILEDMGAEIIIANNGKEALDILNKNKRFSIILMDIQMPVMDGYEATKNIQLDEELKNIPILAMTANAVTDDINKSIDCGMKAHIAKPIDEDDMLEKILAHML